MQIHILTRIFMIVTQRKWPQLEGVIGRPNRAVPTPFWCLTLFMRRVWLSSLHLSPVSFHSSALLHSARLHLLNFHFPLHTGWLDSGMAQGHMCHTLKTLIHACNQTRSHLILDQQQRQPNTTECMVWACISPSWTGSPSQPPLTKATNHAQRGRLHSCRIATDYYNRTGRDDMYPSRFVLWAGSEWYSGIYHQLVTWWIL